MKSSARISRVGTSWRVRVPGQPTTFFADGAYGGEAESWEAARAWRDARWDGCDRRLKLTARERAAIRRSTKNYREIAEKYGISPNYVHQLRRSRK